MGEQGVRDRDDGRVLVGSGDVRPHEVASLHAGSSAARTRARKSEYVTDPNPVEGSGCPRCLAASHAGAKAPQNSFGIVWTTDHAL